MVTELFVYKIVFVIEIFIAMHLFSYNQKKRKYFILRFILSIIVVMCNIFSFI